jgi:hypothetical protein
VVTAKDLTANKCKSRVGATANRYLSDEFERQVAWVKTDKTGAVVEEDEDATETNEEAIQNGDNQQPAGGGDNTGGGSQNGGTTGGNGDHDPDGGTNSDE